MKRAGSKVSCILQFEPSQLQLLTLHSGSSPALSFTCVFMPIEATYIYKVHDDVQFSWIFMYVHLKFMVYGRKHTRVLQCSPASVGLVQACPTGKLKRSSRRFSFCYQKRTCIKTRPQLLEKKNIWFVAKLHSECTHGKMFQMTVLILMM